MKLPARTVAVYVAIGLVGPSTIASSSYPRIGGIDGTLLWLLTVQGQAMEMPHPIIRHMTFNDTMSALDDVRQSSPMSSEVFVEAVA